MHVKKGVSRCTVNSTFTDCAFISKTCTFLYDVSLSNAHDMGDYVLYYNYCMLSGYYHIKTEILE